jgi:hypothetical protein
MSIRKDGLEKPRDLAVVHQHHHHRVQQHQPCGRKRVWTVPLITSIIGVVALYHFLSTFLPSPATPAGDLTTLANTHNVVKAFDGYDWAALQPSRKLEWQKCYNGKFDCARLDVCEVCDIQPLFWLFCQDVAGEQEYFHLKRKNTDRPGFSHRCRSTGWSLQMMIA